MDEAIIEETARFLFAQAHKMPDINWWAHTWEELEPMGKAGWQKFALKVLNDTAAFADHGSDEQGPNGEELE